MLRTSLILVLAMAAAACSSNTKKTEGPVGSDGFADWDDLVTQFETVGLPLGTTDPADMTTGEAVYLGMVHGEVEDPDLEITATVVADLVLTYDLEQATRPLTSGSVSNLRTTLPGFETPTGELILDDGELRLVDGDTALQPGFGAPNGAFTQGDETLILDLDTSYSGDYVYGPVGNWAEGEVDIRLYDDGGGDVYAGLDADDNDGRWIAIRD